MCRTKELGGRRCPQHTDPVKHAAYNARRRELYALNKAQKTESPESKFIPVNQVRTYYQAYQDDKVSPLDETTQKFVDEAKAFTLSINPDFKESHWMDQDYYDFDEADGEMSPARSLIYYTETGYNHMRNILNAGTPADLSGRMQREKAWEDWNKTTIGVIDKTIARASEPEEPRLLFRGMRVPLSIHATSVDNWLDENFPVGGIVSQKSYMSTTMNAATALRNFGKDYHDENRAIIMEIVSKKGAPLGPGTSAYGFQEMEVLMARESKFKIVNVIKDVQYGAVDGDNVKVEGKVTIIRLVDMADEDNS